MTTWVYELSVDEAPLFLEFDKPRYLLPEGCKDLYDVILLQEQAAAGGSALKRHVSMPASESTPPVCITISGLVTVGALAHLLQVKPYRLICTLIKFKTFACITSVISFDTAAKVCAYYGVAVHKAEDF
ncbi:MAG: hypothetical protein NTY98_15805 [Verrucomicrobia bacterium]|nr:hypothetical protein [Verrucomicrobiota bacterium]